MVSKADEDAGRGTMTETGGETQDGADPSEPSRSCGGGYELDEVSTRETAAGDGEAAKASSKAWILQYMQGGPGDGSDDDVREGGRSL